MPLKILIFIFSIMTLLMVQGCARDSEKALNLDGERLCVPSEFLSDSTRNIAGFHRTANEVSGSRFVSGAVPKKVLLNYIPKFRLTWREKYNKTLEAAGVSIRISSRESVNDLASLQNLLIAAASEQSANYIPSVAKGYRELWFSEDWISLTWRGIVSRQYKSSDSYSVRTFINWNPAICLELDDEYYDPEEGYCEAQLMQEGIWVQYRFDLKNLAFLPEIESMIKLLLEAWREDCR